METSIATTPQGLRQPLGKDAVPASPFSQERVTITKEEHINLIHQAKYWKAQHTQLKKKCVKLEEESLHKDAKIKDLQNRLFGKKSEKTVWRNRRVVVHRPPVVNVGSNRAVTDMVAPHGQICRSSTK